MWENCHDVDAYEYALRLKISNDPRTQYVLVYADAGTKIPMVLKDKPPHLAGCLNLPGGKVEPGEGVFLASLRELEEETGLGPCDQPELLGVIKGDTCDIHCVKIQVHYKDLRQRPAETETVSWRPLESLHTDARLMPNLRLVIPLMKAGAAGWEVLDYGEDWRGDYHHVKLRLAGGWEPLEVVVKGLSYYKAGTQA